MTGPSPRSLIELQRLLLPPALPSVKCTEVAAAYRPHNDEFRIGGDWYDLIDRADDQVVALVGDVVGHGVNQISAMGQLRAAANALARLCRQPHELLSWLDDFAQGIPEARYATVMVVMLDGSTTVRVASAGHPPLLHVRSDGSFASVETGRRTPLTVPAPAALSGSLTYQVDDLLAIFTDGLVERRKAPLDRSMAELGRFIADRRDRTCTEIAEAVIDDFAAGADDDAALVLLRPRNHRAPDFHLRDFLPTSVAVRGPGD